MIYCARIENLILKKEVREFAKMIYWAFRKKRRAIYFKMRHIDHDDHNLASSFRLCVEVARLKEAKLVMEIYAKSSRGGERSFSTHGVCLSAHPPQWVRSKLSIVKFDKLNTKWVCARHEILSLLPMFTATNNKLRTELLRSFPARRVTRMWN